MPSPNGRVPGKRRHTQGCQVPLPAWPTSRANACRRCGAAWRSGSSSPGKTPTRRSSRVRTPVSEEDLETVDRLDSELSRNGDRIWGTDTYGIIEHGDGDPETRPRVVCTSYPQILEAEPFAREVEDATTDRLNDALWEFCQRVVANAQEALEDFVSE